MLPFHSVLTSNILGSFYDPFEFQGTYGSSIDEIRNQVFDLVIAHEALASNLSDLEIRTFFLNQQSTEKEVKEYRESLIQQAVAHDQQHGPTLCEISSDDMLQALKDKQRSLQDLGFNIEDLDRFIAFVKKYKDCKVFQFLRNNPRELLSLDKAICDQAARTGKGIPLPILSSSYPLKGKNIKELKLALLDKLFSEETFKLAKPKAVLQKSLAALDPKYLEKYFGVGADQRDLEGFCSPAGQTLFYWLYQSLNFHLIAKDSAMINQVNKVKDVFVKTLGDSVARARLFREKVEAAGFGVVFTQESNAQVRQVLKDAFLPVDKQNDRDGSFVFLKKDLWQPDYQVLTVEDYPDFVKGKINLVLATSQLTGEKFLFASCHGDSNNAADGRLQISLVMERFKKEAQKYPGLQLMIGIDANTKSEKEVSLLRKHLDRLGLIATSAGPTTIKKRMVTVQHGKAGRSAVDEEDFLITLKSTNGGKYQLTHPTIGFKEEKPDPCQFLPNIENPSDHYAVGASIEKMEPLAKLSSVVSGK